MAIAKVPSIDGYGLSGYGARYYDPVLCHFTQADTLVQAPGDPQSFNRYAYCRNNPLKYTDPTGHFWIAVLIGAIIGAISGGIAASQAGGNVAKGIIFGAVIGAVTAVCIQAAVASMNSLALGSGGAISAMENAFITGTEFAIGGFGAGLSSGYGGGANSTSNMFKSAFIGAGIGFATGFAVGYSYQAGWQSAIHGNDSISIEKFHKQYNKAIGAGNLEASIQASNELQSRGIAPQLDVGGVSFDSSFFSGGLGQSDSGNIPSFIDTLKSLRVSSVNSLTNTSNMTWPNPMVGDIKFCLDVLEATSTTLSIIPTIPTQAGAKMLHGTKTIMEFVYDRDWYREAVKEYSNNH